MTNDIGNKLSDVKNLKLSFSEVGDKFIKTKSFQQIINVGIVSSKKRIS